MPAFSATIGKWCQGASGKQDRLRRAVIIELFGAVIKDTPVDTGRLRSSWRCSIGTPSLDADPAVRSRQESNNEVISMALNSAPDSVVILTNAMDYAARIEYDGWSKKKSPDGMVRRNVLRFRAILMKHNGGLSTLPDIL
jgi:hypothetical protein